MCGVTSMKSSELFLELIKRNFSPTDTICVAKNPKFYNEKHPEMQFARDNLSQHFIKVSELREFVKNNKDTGDLYLCYTPLASNSRKKVEALPTYMVVQDIDGAKIPDDLPPSYVWETSLNKYQGVWILDHELDPREHELICRQLIVKYGFDKCGSDVVHLYRIPGTMNHKYKTPYNVSHLQGEGTVYRKKDLMKHLSSDVVRVSGPVSNEKIAMKSYDLDELLETYRLTNLYKNSQSVDRSNYSFTLGTRAVNNGISKEELKFLLLNLPNAMAKWNFDTVDGEVNRIFEKAELFENPHGNKADMGSMNFSGTNRAKAGHLGAFTMRKISEVALPNKEEQWLVEGLWANKSVGIIGAPPKSFKSTLVRNLVLAIAKGEPFCGRETKQGSVLMVLGESDEGQEKMNMLDVEGVDEETFDNKDLPIYFLEEPLTLDQVLELAPLIKEADIKLLVLDPMYMLIGEDLNKQDKVSAMLKMITALRDITECAVMLVHHSKKLGRGEKIRPSDLFGTTFIESWYESLILLQRKGATVSELKTYFRNHMSGTKYDLHVNPTNLRTDLYEQTEEDEWSDFDSLRTGGQV